MSDHDDFAFEPVPGLPERLPAGEEMLWQGRPATMALARDAFALYWIAAYMGLIVLWKAGSGLADGGLPRAMALGLPYLVLMAAGIAVILLLARAQARATLYTITTARVVMRVGAALSVTFNLPFTRLEGAGLDLRKDGTGTIALKTEAETRLSYAVLWPHVRPWAMRRTEPALRCIPDAARVARLLADAAETRMSLPVISAVAAPAGAAPVAAE